MHPLQALQKHKLITIFSVFTPAPLGQRQGVSCRSTVIAAVTLQSKVLTPALYEGEDGILLLR